MNRIFSFLLASVILSGVSRGFAYGADETLPKALTPELFKKTLESARDKSGLPGITGGVLMGGALTRAATGYRALGNPTPMQVADKFHIGSCFKSITATLAARLVEQGVLRWNLSIGEAYPEYFKSMNPKLAKVTLEQLLAHRGGINDEVGEALQQEVQNFKGSPRDMRKAFLPKILALRNHTPIGEFRYSNFGYAIVGGMIEKVTSSSFEDLLQRLVFKPLTMDNVVFGPPGSNDPRDFSTPRGHDENGKPLLPINQPDPSGLSPAGLFSMTVSDWASYTAAHLTGKDAYGNIFLSKDLLNRLHSGVGKPIVSTKMPNGVVVSASYGYGWYVVSQGSNTVLTHDGSNNYWLAKITMIPNKQLAILLMTNRISGPEVFDIATPALSKANNKLLLVLIPNGGKAIADSLQTADDGLYKVLLGGK